MTTGTCYRAASMHKNSDILVGVPSFPFILFLDSLNRLPFASSGPMYSFSHVVALRTMHSSWLSRMATEGHPQMTMLTCAKSNTHFIQQCLIRVALETSSVHDFHLSLLCDGVAAAQILPAMWEHIQHCCNSGL